jgi:hypothetical protein
LGAVVGLVGCPPLVAEVVALGALLLPPLEQALTKSASRRQARSR